MTPQQEKYLTEKFIRPMVRKMLREDMTQIHQVRKSYNGKNEVVIAVYYDRRLADQICKILQKNSEYEDFVEQIKYSVISMNQVSPAKPKLAIK